MSKSTLTYTIMLFIIGLSTLLIQAQETPQATRELRSIQSPTPQPASPTLAATPLPIPTYRCGGEVALPQNRVVTTFDYAAKTAQVSQVIEYRNNTDIALVDLMLDVPSNRAEGALNLQTIMLDMQPIPYQLDQNRLNIPLPAPLNPSCVVALSLRFDLTLPRIQIGGDFEGYFGYGERQINLGHWLPVIAPRIDNQWRINPPQSTGEQTVWQMADWDMTLALENAPATVVVAMPGDVTRTTNGGWHSVHTQARDFTITMSQSYRVKEATVGDTTIELYHFPDTTRATANGTVDGAAHALQVAAESFEQYQSLFGDIPYNRLLIVQGDFPDGMEFSGIVFVGTAWFYDFSGGGDNWLTMITVHEVAHQWWYASVGNDAAYDPYLDEALSLYSEYIYLEEFYPQWKDWWWAWRVGFYQPQGAVDSTVYDFQSGRPYINAVYLRGAQMLHEVRSVIGTQAFFDWLATYATNYAGEIANSADFWSSLSAENYQATLPIRERYLSQTDPRAAP